MYVFRVVQIHRSSNAISNESLCGCQPQGPTTATGEGSFTPGVGHPPRCTWPVGRVAALLCVASTQSSEKGTVWGLRWHNLPRERKGVQGGEDRQDREMTAVSAAPIFLHGSGLCQSAVWPCVKHPILCWWGCMDITPLQPTLANMPGARCSNSVTAAVTLYCYCGSVLSLPLHFFRSLGRKYFGGPIRTMSKASGTIGQGGATLVHLKSNRFQIKRAGKLTLTMHELVFESDGIFAKNFSIMLRNVQSCKQTETSSGHPAIEVIFLASSGVLLFMPPGTHCQDINPRSTSPRGSTPVDHLPTHSQDATRVPHLISTQVCSRKGIECCQLRQVAGRRFILYIVHAKKIA